MEKSKLPNDLKNISQEDEIDFLNIYNFILRNKFLISSVSIVFLLISVFYSLTKKYIWEGRFQIVLESNSTNNISSDFMNNLKIPGFSSLQMNNRSSLDTEVAILESPLVLMPVFEYVKDEKIKLESNVNKYSFQDWKDKNLKVVLKEGTSVLNISYRDQNKPLIKPVLNKISKIYQDYSGESKKRNFQLAYKYLSNQILLFKKKSFESIKKVQEYAISQDLKIIDLYNEPSSSNLKDSLDKNPILSNIGIENVRVNAANKIRKIDIQINQIEDLSNNAKEIQYIGSTIPGLVEEGLPEILEDIETNLIELRSKYTEKDESIIRLLEKRDLYIGLLKERAIGYLKADRMLAESIMFTAMRPKGVLLKYKELVREANRDENMLVELENQLKVIKLEEARLEDPWKLITKPTILDYPVAPRKRNIILIGTFFGFLIGSLISFIKEKREA